MVKVHLHVSVVARWEWIMDKKLRTPKMKISKTDINYFGEEKLVVDKYWEDLYNPKDYGKNKKGKH